MSRELIYQIHDMMGIKKIPSEHHVGEFKFEGVMGTGDFSAMYDYNAGILKISIFSLKNYNSKLVVTISTVDDGVWQAYAKEPLSFDKLEEIANGITERWNNKLPTEEVLNEFLNTYGVHGTYVG